MKYLQSAKVTIEGQPFFLRSTTNPEGIDFDFSITRDRYNPYAEISMTFHNLSEATIQLLNTKSEKFTNSAKIICEAGYRGVNKLIFSGTVYKCRTSFTSGAKITQVTVSSYTGNFVFKPISLSYRTGPRPSQLLIDAGRAADVVINTSKLKTKDDTNVGANGSSYSFSGTLQDLVNVITTQKPGISVELYNDVLIASSLETDETNPVEVLSAENGLIGTPVLTDSNLIKAEAVFNPDYTIAAFLEIISRNFQQNKVKGEIYKLTHDVTVQGGTSVVEILPIGQASPINNIGVTA